AQRIAVVVTRGTADEQRRVTAHDLARPRLDAVRRLVRGQRDAMRAELHRRDIVVISAAPPRAAAHRRAVRAVVRVAEEVAVDHGLGADERAEARGGALAFAALRRAYADTRRAQVDDEHVDVLVR